MKAKDKILNVASELFHQQGYNSTGINEIIEKSCVAKATFYNHFKSKEDLAIAYLEHRHGQWFDQLCGATKGCTSVEDRILESFSFIEKMNRLENYRGCAFLNMISEVGVANPNIHRVIQSHKTDLQKFFKDILQDEERAFLIYMLFEASIVESQVYRNQAYVKKVKDIVASSI